jgi:hypothetical protein
MSTDSFSKKDLEELRRLWDVDPERFMEEASTEISEVVSRDVEEIVHPVVPERKEDQVKALDSLIEGLGYIIKDSENSSGNVFKESVHNFQNTLNDPKIIKGLGDKVRVVMNFIADKLLDLMGTQESLNSFLEDVVGSAQMGLETARGMQKDITPMEIKVLETLFNALKVPYSPIDVVQTFLEKDQQKTYKLAFQTDEKDLDKETIRGLLRSQSILRKCKEDNVDEEIIKTAEEEVSYWQSLTYSEPFPAEREKKLDEFYRFKTQLRNWELVMKGEITYEEMVELYRKLKPKSKNE